MDILGEFLGDCCIQSADAQVTSADLNTAYKDWCEKHRHKPLSGRALGLSLKERGFTQERAITARMWNGLSLKEEDLWSA